MLATRHPLLIWILVLSQFAGGLGVLCDEGAGRQVWELVPCGCDDQGPPRSGAEWTSTDDDSCGPCQDARVVAIRQGGEQTGFPPQPLLAVVPPPEVVTRALPLMPAVAVGQRARSARAGPDLVGIVVLTC